MPDDIERLRAHAASLLARVDELAATYRDARPWPHLVLTDLLDPAVVAAAYEEERPRAADLELSRNHRQAKAVSDSGFGPSATAILAFLESPEMVCFLRRLTGIEDLEPDPAHTWAGLHANPRGAFHALHQDFTRHPVDGRWHRVNVLVYLNPEWPAAWGGHLELWATDGDSAQTVVVPAAPNVVLFETSATTLHGLPDPITAPDGVARISLNSYLYTQEPAPSAPPLQPLLRRPRRPSDSWFTGIATRWEIVHGIQHRTPLRVRELSRTLRRRVRSLRD